MFCAPNPMATPAPASNGRTSKFISFKEVLGGMFLMMENQIRVNDVVVINGKTGLVEEINLRTTVLRGEDGVDKLADSGAVIKARFKTIPNQQWMVGREMNLRIIKRFDETKIAMPSSAPTVNVVMPPISTEPRT
jgi:small-conductance mechanosensitive channel